MSPEKSGCFSTPEKGEFSKNSDIVAAHVRLLIANQTTINTCIVSVPQYLPKPKDDESLLFDFFDNLGLVIRLGHSSFFGCVGRFALGCYIGGVFGNLAEVAQ